MGWGGAEGRSPSPPRPRQANQGKTCLVLELGEGEPLLGDPGEGVHNQGGNFPTRMDPRGDPTRISRGRGQKNPTRALGRGSEMLTG
jgi:hypothetical protein